MNDHIRFIFHLIFIVLLGIFTILTIMFYSLPEEAREGVVAYLCDQDDLYCHPPVKFIRPANLN